MSMRARPEVRGYPQLADSVVGLANYTTLDKQEMEKLNTEELDQVAGGNFIGDAIDAAGKAVNAVGDAIGYIKRQVDLYDADMINTSKLQKAAEKNGIEKPTTEKPTRSGRSV